MFYTCFILRYTVHVLFDRVGGLGFVFDVFCVTPLFLASQSLLVLNCWHCHVLLYFLTEAGLRIIRNISKLSTYSFLKAVLLLVKHYRHL